MLEVRARSRQTQLQQPSRVKELRAEVVALRTQRDQLKAEIETHKVGRVSLLGAVRVKGWDRTLFIPRGSYSSTAPRTTWSVFHGLVSLETIKGKSKCSSKL